MQIVLLEDVKSLGKKGEIVKVNEGYARNFILPKKLGVEATAKNLNDLKLKKANEEKVAAQQLAEATRSEVVQVIGTKFILYRRNQKNPKIQLKKNKK